MKKESGVDSSKKSVRGKGKRRKKEQRTRKVSKDQRTK